MHGRDMGIVTEVEEAVEVRYQHESGEYNSVTHYFAPNENILEWQRVMKTAGSVERAVSIASGGEIALLAILPHVQEEFIIVDHSYTSLTCTMLKWLLLKEHGPEETFRMLTTIGSNFVPGPTYGSVMNVEPPADLAELKTALEALCRYLPPDLVKGCEKKYSHPIYTVLYEQQKNPLFYSNHPEITSYWTTAGLEAAVAASRNLDACRFVHGDLVTDIGRVFKPVDLVYISNAQGHTGRNGYGLDLDKLASTVKPGGFVLSSGSLAYYEPLVSYKYADVVTRGWEHVTGGKSYSCMLYRTPVPAKKLVEAAVA